MVHPIFIAVLVGLALVPSSPRPATPQPDHQSARLLDIGWTTQEGGTKIVVHLDKPVRFRTTTDGRRLAVDLWPVAEPLSKVLDVNARQVGVVYQTRMEQGVVRLSITLQGTVRYKIFTRAQPYKLAVVVLPVWQAARPVPRSVAYQKMRTSTGSGSTRAHVVTVDVTDPRIELRPVLGSGVVPGREPAGAAATRHDALAAINGGFFTVGTGQPLGLVVIDGKLLSTPFPRRSVFAITAGRRPVIHPFTFKGTVQTDRGDRVPVSAVNRPPRSGGVAVYTPEYGPLTPPHRLHAIVRNSYVTGFTSGRIAIPADGYVLSAAPAEAHFILANLSLNQRLRLDLIVTPGSIEHAIGGGPRLVRGGVIDIPYHWEFFRGSFYRRRTSRSAVGITKSGKVLLVTVEGPSRTNSGMSLRELARLMRHLGAIEAMNLDGGGSSTLVVGGRVVNRTEQTQRGISSMLVVVRRMTP